MKRTVTIGAHNSSFRSLSQSSVESSSSCRPSSLPGSLNKFHEQLCGPPFSAVLHMGRPANHIGLIRPWIRQSSQLWFVDSSVLPNAFLAGLL